MSYVTINHNKRKKKMARTVGAKSKVPSKQDLKNKIAELEAQLAALQAKYAELKKFDVAA
jgi:hypothetical protein